MNSGWTVSNSTAYAIELGLLRSAPARPALPRELFHFELEGKERTLDSTGGGFALDEATWPDVALPSHGSLALKDERTGELHAIPDAVKHRLERRLRESRV